MSARDWVLFQQVFGYGTTRAGKVLRQFGGASGLFEPDGAALRDSGFLTAAELERLAQADFSAAERIVERCDENGYLLLTPENEAYPARLRELYSPAAVLYCMGDLSGLDDTLAIAMVGTRRATGYGVRAAKQLAAELAGCGVITVSGLALGIDSACHKATLEAGGRTIAVQGCGPDLTYPASNCALKREILQNGGAVVSEFPPGTPPLAYHFPIRNRIISGLSNGTIVVEGSRKSGSLITAAHALTQGRDVFAVPGNIDQPMSEATNWLIREGAVLATCAADVLEEYRGMIRDLPPKPPLRRSGKQTPVQTALPDAPDFLDETQQTLYALLSAQPVSCDELVERSGLSVPQVLSALTQLEILGLVRVYPGRLFGI